MTQEDKELLVKDLCARLPYGVKVNITSRESKNRIVYLTEDNISHLTNGWWSECEPYLFPLSSMTEEQFNEMHNYCYNAEREASKFSNGELKIIYNYELFKFDYLNRNHFDYRGLITMGLAIDATDKNIY